MRAEEKTLSLTDYILCTILSIAFAAAPNYLNTGKCPINLPFVLTALVYLFIFILLTYVIRRILESRFATRPQDEIGKSIFLQRTEVIFKHKYGMLIIAAIIFVCWLPTLLSLYPGTLINDTWGQLRQYIRFVSGKSSLSDHHPILDTLVMGVCIVPFSEATGNWHLGIFLYVVIQAILTCLAFSYAVRYMFQKLKLGTGATLFLCLLYCLHPMYPASAQTVSKDALSAWLFVLFFTDFIEIVRTRGCISNRKSFFIRFLAESILVILTKKTGLYVVLLSFVALIIFLRPVRKILAISLTIIAVLHFGLTPVVFRQLNIKQGGVQEMFSLPFQMTARYVSEHPEDITEFEYQVIDKVLTMEDLAERYNYTNADPVKQFEQKGETGDYWNYLKVWIKQGLRHPDTYLNATNAMLSGWFSWSIYMPLTDMNWHSQLNTKWIPEWVPERTVSAESAEGFREFYNNLYSIPFLTIFFSYGFYASVIPAFAVGTVLKRRRNKEKKYWLALVPIILSLVLGCWLAPVSVHLEGKRYLYPLTYTMPIVLGWCLYIYQDGRNKETTKNTSEKS